MDLSRAFVAIAMLQRPAILKTPGGRRVMGKWEDAGPAAVKIKAVIQAATQEDLVQYNTEDKLDGFVRIWTAAELRTVDEDLQADAQQIITPEGAAYRIVKAGRRNEAGFTRAIGRLVKNDRGRSVSSAMDIPR
ncbi:hypothetical protein FF100_04870 [Methylobacterium terricola]|uniref:Uncharacterized protein n=1 Tax=Methylobacterium terricola TaxID=2583531 RepID=A0A5C4LN83_9HYPH|nr:hypothetical protein [Methylobacterium terricola]TNC14911.1 hypothetical protein FF100_04870 [Methylobacterium terricola]